MFSFLKKITGINEKTPLPWNSGEAIYGFIRRNLDSESGCLKDSAVELPDDKKRFPPGELRWVAGGLDGVTVQHLFRGENDLNKAKKIADFIVSISKTGQTKAKIGLYNGLTSDHLIEFFDSAIQLAIDAGIDREPHLHDFAKFLATNSPDRGPVKLGIALLGIIGDFKDLEIIVSLGKHEEFTLFSAFAIKNSTKPPDTELFNLAQCVTGWGKIFLVEKLAQTNNPKIRSWMLRDGYKNSIMNEYLAYICAVTGELHEALGAETVDQELFDGAGELIEALITGGPAEDMNDYEHSAVTISRYLQHFPNHPRFLKHFLVLASITRYLSDDEWDVSASKKNGWDNELRKRMLEFAQNFSNQEEWFEQARKGLSSNNQKTFYEADRAAQLLGINIWEIHWKRLEESPLEPARWYSVMVKANRENIDQIIALAIKEIPLDRISTGPAKDSGFGPDFQAHSCLDYILQELNRFPGKGKDLILAGLDSPVIRNRNMALKALSAWDPKLLDGEIISLLKKAYSEEPDTDVKERIKKIINE